MKIEAGDKYRLLKVGETIKEGDEYCLNDVWFKEIPSCFEKIYDGREFFLLRRRKIATPTSEYTEAFLLRRGVSLEKKELDAVDYYLNVSLQNLRVQRDVLIQENNRLSEELRKANEQNRALREVYDFNSPAEIISRG
jgi:hypothetical protein